MRIVLVQHGLAFAKDEDPDRPLTDTGRRDMNALSTLLSQTNQLPERVLHSGRARARQSAELLSVATAPQARDGLAPDDPPDALAEEAGTWREDVMIVGHQPFLGRFASQLLTGSADAVTVRFQPGSALCLERGEDGRWALAWMVAADLLAAD